MRDTPSELIIPAVAADLHEICQEAVDAGCSPDLVARACYEAIDAWYHEHPPQTPQAPQAQ
ncbi:hypothetical protein [Fodinicurvata sp. EGI_FJ10296]|jgi:hypothetical protein|uniref:hypothetical protein n=1 Tax=Fodinicurvata sp. EGI_FJ10296 TaxID=3231908 RepID=UPI00345411F8